MIMLRVPLTTDDIITRFSAESMLTVRCTRHLEDGDVVKLLDADGRRYAMRVVVGSDVDGQVVITPIKKEADA